MGDHITSRMLLLPYWWIRYHVWGVTSWLRHWTLTHLYRLKFCGRCAGYFDAAYVIGSGEYQEVLCESCYVHIIGTEAQHEH